jgi:type IV pilus assembly protein PilV
MSLSARKLPRGPHRSRGITLIEVMVTVVVISFGLISLAGLQLANKRGGHSSHQRTLALTVANDILERMAVNPTQAAAYHTGAGNGALGGGTLGAAIGRNCSAAGITCTPAELAAFDRWAWERRLDGVSMQSAAGNDVSGLLDARGCVIFAPAAAATPNSGQVRVIVSWRALSGTTDAATDAGLVCGAGAANSVTDREQVVLESYVVNPADYQP